MATTTLVASGDSLVLTLPSEVVEQLHLAAGNHIDVEASDGKLIIRRHRYTLQELVDECDPNAPVSEEDHAWDRMLPVGREII